MCVVKKWLTRSIIELIYYSECRESWAVLSKTFVFIFNVSVSLLQIVIYYVLLGKYIMLNATLERATTNNNIVTNYLLLQGNNSSTTNEVYICITLIYVNPLQKLDIIYKNSETYFTIEYKLL